MIILFSIRDRRVSIATAKLKKSFHDIKLFFALTDIQGFKLQLVELPRGAVLIPYRSCLSLQVVFKTHRPQRIAQWRSSPSSVTVICLDCSLFCRPTDAGVRVVSWCSTFISFQCATDALARYITSHLRFTCFVIHTGHTNSSYLWQHSELMSYKSRTGTPRGEADACQLACFYFNFTVAQKPVKCCHTAGIHAGLSHWRFCAVRDARRAAIATNVKREGDLFFC